MARKLLKGNDVAELLGVSRSLAYQLMRTGEIQCVRFGRTIRVTPEAIDKFLEERTVSNTNCVNWRSN